MGWMIYLTALGHISQRGSRCTTWTTTIFSPIISSIDQGIDVMRRLFNHGADANGRNHYGIVLLHKAADNTQIEEVKVLLGCNADTNTQDNDGHTPLYTTIYYARHSATILEHGADPNTSKCSHRRSTSFASSRGFLEVARLLFSSGVKVDEKDRKGRIVSQLAAKVGQHDIYC